MYDLKLKRIKFDRNITHSIKHVKCERVQSFMQHEHHKIRIHDVQNISHHQNLTQLIRNKFVFYKDMTLILAPDTRIPLIGDLISLM